MNADRHLPMLFSRMVWPSPLARERACTAIALLLADPAQAPRVRDFFLRWLKAQHHESVCGMALLPLLRAKEDAGGVCPIPARDVRDSLAWPSLQSSLLLGEYDPAAHAGGEWSAWHSGDPPGPFTPVPFFEQYLRNFLPPVYEGWAKEFEQRMLIPFRRQWAYEWDVVLRRRPYELSPAALRYWMGHQEADERCVAVDTPLSEVYRSAYLRALVWAVDTRGMDRDVAAERAADTVPIDLELWPLRPGRRPAWWPAAAPRLGALEAAAADIWPAVDELWRRQHAGEPDWGADWVLALADGQVRGGETVYDLAVTAFFQRSLGAEAPGPDDVFAWCSGNEVAVLRPRTASRLRCAGAVRAERARDVAERLADWGLLPAVGRLRLGGTVARWQWWRWCRGLWGPTPVLSRDGYSFRRDGDSLAFEGGGEAIGRWTDWTEGLGERLAPETLPATGQVLLLRREAVERCEKVHQVRLCWVARLTAFCRQRHYELHRPVHDHRVYGASKIVLPG